MTGERFKMDNSSALQPAFSDNNIPIVFSSDNNYVPYLSVAIESLIINGNSKNNYDIIILNTDISSRNQELLTTQTRSNVAIRFFNVSEIIKNYKQLFFIWNRFSEAAYYRLFADQIFRNYNKILYIDIDTIILRDIAELFSTPLENNLIAATRNSSSYKITYQNGIWNGKHFRDYLMTVLNLPNPYDYFQSGVMVMNVELMRKENLTEKNLEALKKIKDPILVDQCILNFTCCGRVKYLDLKWNFEWVNNLDLNTFIYQNFLDEALHAAKDPYIIHYNGKQKVWAFPEKSLAQFWWKYAHLSPYYEEILYRNIKQPIPDISKQINYLEERVRLAVSLPLIKLKYYRYKLLSKITLGKTAQKYKNKRQIFKEKIKIAKSFIKKGK